MSETIEAVYDGKSLLLAGPLQFPANTRVTVTVEPLRQPTAGEYGFLDTALNANLSGPADWSTNLDEYLYGGKDSAQ